MGTRGRATRDVGGPGEWAAAGVSPADLTQILTSGGHTHGGAPVQHTVSGPDSGPETRVFLGYKGAKQSNGSVCMHGHMHMLMFIPPSPV